MNTDHTPFYDKVFCCVELIEEQNINFFRQFSDEKHRFHPNLKKMKLGASSRSVFEWPLFAAGRVCTHTILDAMLVRLSLNPLESELWASFFTSTTDEFGCADVVSFLKDTGFPVLAGDDPGLSPRSLEECTVKKTDGNTAVNYEDVFLAAIDKGETVLGLYRPTGTRGAFMPYAHTNPPLGLEVVHGDQIFYLKCTEVSRSESSI